MGEDRGGDSLVGIDIGTSVIKTILFDFNGHEIGSSSRTTKLLHPRPSWVECDMDEVLSAVLQSLRALLTKASGRKVHAIGITGQGDGTWLIDHDDCPVRPAITWLDGRSSEYVDLFEKTGISRDVFQSTWSVLSNSNQAVQLRWLKDHEPESLRRAKAIVRAKDWIFYKLTGRLSTDYTDASHTYFDVRKGSYNQEILRLIGIDELWPLLPEAFAPNENRAGLLPGVARRLGLSADTPVISGPIDVVASDLGVGAVHPGDACTVLGTASIHQIVTRPFTAIPEQMGYTIRHAPADLWIMTLPTMAGTINTEWFIKSLYLGSDDESPTANGGQGWTQIEEAVRTVPFGSHGIIYHPFIDPAGERAPFVHQAARAQFTGLTSRHNRSAMARAVYEGVVLSALDCYSRLRTDVKRLRLTGGGCRSSIWPEMFADALGCPVEIVAGREAGAMGAVINAAVSLGIYSSYEEACLNTVKLSRVVAPTEGMSEKYRRLLELYRKTYAAMLPIWDDFYSLFSEIDPE